MLLPSSLNHYPHRIGVNTTTFMFFAALARCAASAPLLTYCTTDRRQRVLFSIILFSSEKFSLIFTHYSKYEGVPFSKIMLWVHCNCCTIRGIPNWFSVKIFPKVMVYFAFKFNLWYFITFYTNCVRFVGRRKFIFFFSSITWFNPSNSSQMSQVKSY